MKDEQWEIDNKKILTEENIKGWSELIKEKQKNNFSLFRSYDRETAL